MQKAVVVDNSQLKNLLLAFDYEARNEAELMKKQKQEAKQNELDAKMKETAKKVKDAMEKVKKTTKN